MVREQLAARRSPHYVVIRHVGALGDHTDERVHGLCARFDPSPQRTGPLRYSRRAGGGGRGMIWLSSYVSFAATTQHLPGVLHSLEPALDRYGYLAVAAFVLLEDFGVPVPGETILVLGAVYAGTGRLNVVLVALIGFVAAVIGDNIGFAIGHFAGRPLIERYGRYVLITPERLETATGFFERQGAKVVVVARFIEGLRQANGIIAGMSGMHWARFLAFNAIGAALWVAVWTSIGYVAGSHITAIYNAATRYEGYLAIAFAALVILYVASRLKRSRARSAPEDD